MSPHNLIGWTCAGLVLGAVCAAAVERDSTDTRPNILWVILEDTNDWMGCYGDTLARTPNIDKLAADGIRFDRAYMTAGICSPARSALITGMYQTSINAQHHRSSRPAEDPEMWEPNYIGVLTVTELFRQAGYYTFSEGTQKDDYNFVWEANRLYDWHRHHLGFEGARDGSGWSGVPEGQPFFGQIQLLGGKHSDVEAVTNRAAVEVPPYYPDHPVIRDRIAHHYDTIVESDRELGEILDRLKEDGLYENTVIMFFSDHGMELLRHKQFLYEGGIRVPFIITGPGLPEGESRGDLVSAIDIGPTSLVLAGIPVPDHMHGRDALDDDFDRQYVIAARDRAGIAIDRIRSVTTDNYKYIRNYMTDRPWMQPQYRDTHEHTIVMKRLYEEGQLDEAQARFMGPERPAEEFYDLQADPHEINNLVHDPRFGEELARHRRLLAKWKIETDDKGQYPESKRELRGILRNRAHLVVNPEFDLVEEN